MTLTISDSPASPLTRYRASRNYKFVLFESNLYDTDIHPVAGIACPGLHTAVADLTPVGRDKKIDFVLNKAGQISFRVPLTSTAASLIFGYEIRRAVVVYLDIGGVSTPIWSGMVWNAEALADNNTLNVTVVGWFELLNHREFRRQLVFTSIDAGVIASRIVATANNQIANDNVVSSGSPFNPNTSAEDLMFGAGEFESANDYVDLSGGFSILAPSTAWCVSGNNSLQFSMSNKGSTEFIGIRVSPPYANLPLVPSSFGLVPVDASVNYQFRYTINVTTSTGSTRYVRSTVNWYNSSGTFISQTGGVINNLLGVSTFADTHNSPAGAVYAQLYFGVATDSAATIAGYLDAASFSKTSVGVRPTPISVGTIASPANPSGANRTRTYQVGQKMGPAIEELSQIEAGFDFDVSTVSTPVTGPGNTSGVTLLRKFNVYYGTVKAATSLKGVGSDKTNVVWGYRWGPNNLASVRESHDSSKLANRVNGRSPNAAARVHDTTSIALRSLFEDSVTISDSNIADNIILYYAGSEVAYRKAPLIIYNIVPFPWDGDSITGRIPRFLVDYIIGDVTYLVADYGALQIGRTGTGQPVRIYGITISVDMEGNEKVESLQTAVS